MLPRCPIRVPLASTEQTWLVAEGVWHFELPPSQTISVVIPSSILVGGITPLRAEPSFIIEAPKAAGLFGGTLLRNVEEGELRTTANFTLSVTLSGDEWSEGIGEKCASGDGAPDCVTTTMLSNLVATSSSTNGWNSIVRGSLGVSAVEVDRELAAVYITFPAFPEYRIDSP